MILSTTEDTNSVENSYNTESTDGTNGSIGNPIPGTIFSESPINLFVSKIMLTTQVIELSPSGMAQAMYTLQPVPMKAITVTTGMLSKISIIVTIQLNPNGYLSTMPTTEFLNLPTVSLNSLIVKEVSNLITSDTTSLRKFGSISVKIYGIPVPMVNCVTGTLFLDLDHIKRAISMHSLKMCKQYHSEPSSSSLTTLKISMYKLKWLTLKDIQLKHQPMNLMTLKTMLTHSITNSNGYLKLLISVA